MKRLSDGRVVRETKESLGSPDVYDIHPLKLEDINLSIMFRAELFVSLAALMHALLKPSFC